jgi:hypothetical protein
MKIGAVAARDFMIGTLVVWGILDAFLYLAYGNPATESATTWHYGYLFSGLTLFIGELMGHFFGQWRKPSTQSVVPPAWRRYGEIILLSIMVPWLAFDAYGILWNHAPSVVDQFVWKIFWHQVWLLFIFGFALGSAFYPMDDPTEFPGDS